MGTVVCIREQSLLVAAIPVRRQEPWQEAVTQVSEYPWEVSWVLNNQRTCESWDIIEQLFEDFQSRFAVCLNSTDCALPVHAADNEG